MVLKLLQDFGKYCTFPCYYIFHDISIMSISFIKWAQVGKKTKKKAPKKKAHIENCDSTHTFDR